MKVVNTTKLFIMNKVEVPGVKDPSKVYYKLVVSQDEDAGTLNCAKEVYDAVEPNTVRTFVTEYNEKYESFKIASVLPVAEKASK